MLADETGRDLMLSIPTLATGRKPTDVESYVVKLAQTLRYGSDGVNPYTREVANPKFPPLNPNLRVYFEIENELWNWFGVFWFDAKHVDLLTEEDINGTPRTSAFSTSTEFPLRVRRTSTSSAIARSCFGPCR